jgi:D-glycero-D-manno-heptose 1,7-bisphosphate phosphatase
MSARPSAVFLDRDGVLIPQRMVNGQLAPTAGEHVDLLPGVADACAQLRDSGLLLVVVTNQPDIARGTVAWAEVDAIHALLRRQLPLDAVYVCPHDDADRCDCRKPQPGLLLRAAGDWDLELASSTLVGDRWRDIEAGRRAGCATVYIRSDYREIKPDRFDASVADLTEAAGWILRRRAA